MSALRLLLVTDAVGGVWIYTLQLARALEALGLETVTVVMGPSPSERQRQQAGGLRLIDTGLPLEWLGTSRQAVERAGATLARIAEAEQADIVQTSSAAVLAGIDFGRPAIAVQHSCVASWWAAVRGSPLPADFQWRRDLVQAGLERAAAVVAPSLAFAAETARLYGVEVQTVYNGRSPMWTRDLPQGDFVFTAGRLWDEAKDAATLDAAAAKVEVPFQAAGSSAGPNGSLVQLANLDVLGPLSETRLAGLYAARPIYASAALYEPFGLSVLEAAQAGCALVLSDIPTHRELWNGAAIFAPPREPEAFAHAVEDLLADRDRRNFMGKIARARSQHYTPGRMARQMTAVYERLTAAAAAQKQTAPAA